MYLTQIDTCTAPVRTSRLPVPVVYPVLIQASMQYVHCTSTINPTVWTEYTGMYCYPDTRNAQKRNLQTPYSVESYHRARTKQNMQKCHGQSQFANGLQVYTVRYGAAQVYCTGSRYKYLVQVLYN